MSARALLWIAALGATACFRPAAPPALGELSGRSVSSPSRLGWVSSAAASAELPSAVALGGRASGRVLVYLEFPPEGEPRRLLRADLVVAKLPSATSDVLVKFHARSLLQGSCARGRTSRARFTRA